MPPALWIFTFAIVPEDRVAWLAPIQTAIMSSTPLSILVDVAVMFRSVVIVSTTAVGADESNVEGISFTYRALRVDVAVPVFLRVIV